MPALSRWLQKVSNLANFLIRNYFNTLTSIIHASSGKKNATIKVPRTLQRAAIKFFCFAKHHPACCRQKYTQPGKRNLADLCRHARLKNVTRNKAMEIFFLPPSTPMSANEWYIFPFQRRRQSVAATSCSCRAGRRGEGGKAFCACTSLSLSRCGGGTRERRRARASGSDSLSGGGGGGEEQVTATANLWEERYLY